MAAFHPLRTFGSTANLTGMDKRGLLITLAIVVLLLAVMFYGGMFMHGD